MEAVLRPQSQEAWQPGLVLAFVAHALLLLALAFGVQWQTQTPPVVEAEMWAEMPTAAPEVVATPEPSQPATTQAPPDPVQPMPAEPTPEVLPEPVPAPPPAPLPTPVLKPVPAKAPAKTKTKELFVPDPPEVRERLSHAREALNKASAPVAAPAKPAAPKPVMVPVKPAAEALPVPIPVPAKLPEVAPKPEPAPPLPKPVPKPLPPAPVVPPPAPAPTPVPAAPPPVPAVASKPVPVPVPVAASAAVPGKPVASAGSAATVPKLNEVLTRQEVEQARQSNLKRMMAKLAEDALHSAGPTPEYAGRIIARIKPNIRFTETPSGNPTTRVKVLCAPDGKIISRTILVPSGLASWDQAVLRAIDRTDILPRNEQGKVPSPMQLDFSPRDF